MTKTANATFAAALIAASVFGGSAAFAGGDYYPGVSKEPVSTQSVDRTSTQSIRNGSERLTVANGEQNVGPANGDYFQGVSKN